MKNSLCFLILLVLAPAVLAGIPTSSNWLYYGKDPCSNEQYVISQGWYLGSGWNGQTGTFNGYSVMIGGEGTASITHTGGTVQGINYLSMGYAQGGQGYWTQSGGTMNSRLSIIGSGGYGEYTQTDGTNTIEGGLALGASDSQNYPTAVGGSGIYRLNGGNLYTSRLWIGESSGCSGSFILNGGELVMSGSIAFGQGTGQFLMTGGLFKTTYYSPTALTNLFNTTLQHTGQVVIESQGAYTTAYIVPEPATVILLSLGTLLVFKSTQTR